MQIIIFLYLLYTTFSSSFNNKKICKNCKHSIIVQYPKNIIIEKCQLFKNETDYSFLLADYCKNNKKLCDGLFYNQK